MATQQALTLYEANDENVTVAVTTNDPVTGTVLDLTGATVEAFLKVAASTPDNDAGVWKGSTATGEITLTDAVNGLLEIAIPGSAVTTTKGWWRCDVVVSSRRKTAAYGQVTVVDL